MLPLKDNIPSRTRPVVMYLILAGNILVFLYEIALGGKLNAFVAAFGATPYAIFHPQGVQSYIPLFTSMFIHAGIMHLAGNMLFLWIFADNIEDRFGHIIFIIFYLICGIAGTLLHGILAPDSRTPMVGASGAISGVLGAYILLYPKARIVSAIPFGFFLRVMELPAVAFLGIWFAFQFLLGITSIGARGGVAYFAHIGGFVIGLLFALPYKLYRKKDNAHVIYTIR